MTKATVWPTVLPICDIRLISSSLQQQFSPLFQSPLHSCVVLSVPCHHPCPKPVLHVLHFLLQQQTTFGYQFLFQFFIAIKQTIPKLSDLKQLSYYISPFYGSGTQTRHSRACPSLLHMIYVRAGVF